MLIFQGLIGMPEESADMLDKWVQTFKISEQMLTGNTLYLVTVNDADMKGEGKPYTNPRIDLDDFLNLEVGQDYERKPEKPKTIPYNKLIKR